MTSIGFPYGVSVDVVTRTRSTEKDAEGNRKWTETTATYIGAFDPAIGYESVNGEDRVSAQPQAYLPFDAIVTSTSVLVIADKRYEVDGEPAYWQNPFTGDTPGVQVPLRRVTG